jgi:hypothetical protein
MFPAFSRAPGERGFGRRQLIFAATFAAVVLISVLPYLPSPGGLDQFIDLTAGTQLHRRSLLSLWGLHPSLGWIQDGLRVATVLLGLAFAFIPRERTVASLAAMTAALIIAQQLFLDHWYYLYASWFTAFVVVALFSGLTTDDADPYPAA